MPPGDAVVGPTTLPAPPMPPPQDPQAAYAATSAAKTRDAVNVAAEMRRSTGDSSISATLGADGTTTATMAPTPPLAVTRRQTSKGSQWHDNQPRRSAGYNAAKAAGSIRDKLSCTLR